MDDFTKWVKELAEKHPEPEEFIRAVLPWQPPDEDRPTYLLRVSSCIKEAPFLTLTTAVINEAYNSESFVSWVKKLAERHPDPAEFISEARRSRKAEDTPGRFMNRLGVRLTRLSLARLAIAAYQESLDECQRSNDRPGVAKNRCNIAVAFASMGEDARALDHMARALADFTELEDQLGQARCLAGIGQVRAGRGEFSLAIAFSSKSLAKSREAGSIRDEVISYTNLGVVYRAMGNPRAALRHYEHAARIMEQSGDRHLLGPLCQFMADLYCADGEYDKARECATKGMRIAAETGFTKLEAHCHNTFGVTDLATGNRASALKHHTDALNLATGSDDAETIASAHAYLGSFYRDTGQTEASLDHYQSALSVLDKVGHASEVVHVLADVGRAHLAVGSWDECVSSCAKAVGILETLRREHVPPDSRASYWRRNIPLFDLLVEAAARSGNKTDSVLYSERGKGRTIADLMLMRGIEPERFRPEPMDFTEMQNLACRLKKALVMFRVTERGTFVFTVDTTGELDLTEVPEFTSKRLEDLVVQIEEEKPTRGWFGAYSRYKSSHGEAGKLIAEGKHAEASSLVHEASDRWFSTMETTLAALSSELMAPVFEKVAGLGTRSESSVDSVMSRGGTSRVVLVPNRALNVLPLHACWRTVDGKKRYLLEDYEMTYAPNCNILDLCQKREAESGERSASASLFAVANPAPPYELAFSEWEVDEIARHFAQKEVLVKAEVKQALLERGKSSGVIHLSTHGIHDIGSSFNSRLKLGKDEELTLEEVFEHLRLERNWLVCLSACESGLLDYRDIADEFIGLQAGFLYAGAPTVIASLWSIADYTTALVMMKLYENIYQHRMTKAAALRSAQLWLKDLTAGEALKLLKAKEAVLEYSERMAREDISPVRRAISLEDRDSKPFSHPYFWAGYQSFGV